MVTQNEFTLHLSTWEKKRNHISPIAWDFFREQTLYLLNKNLRVFFFKFLFICIFKNFYWKIVDLQSVLVSGVQQGDSVLYTYLLFLTLSSVIGYFA